MSDAATILSKIATALSLNVEDFLAPVSSSERLLERSALLTAFDRIDDPFTRAGIVRYVEAAALTGSPVRQNVEPL